MVIAAASALIDDGNNVGLQGSVSNAAIPDLWLQPTLLDRVDVEVKTPRIFRGPLPRPMDYKSAVGVIRERIKSATKTRNKASGPEAQIGLNNTGAVIVSGFHLGEANFRVFELAAEAAMTDGAASDRIVGAGIMEITFASTSTGGARPVLNRRFVVNPRYSGDARVDLRQDRR
jgi:hypothetical protein